MADAVAAAVEGADVVGVGGGGLRCWLGGREAGTHGWEARA